MFKRQKSFSGARRAGYEHPFVDICDIKTVVLLLGERDKLLLASGDGCRARNYTFKIGAKKLSDL